MNVVAITAIEIEYKILRDVFSSVQENYLPDGATIYESSTLTGDHNEVINFNLFRCGQGNISAALLTEKAINHCKPDLTLLIGVAGGLKDLDLGDVIFAKKVHGYEQSKEGRVSLTRPDCFHSTSQLTKRAEQECLIDDWKRFSSVSINNKAIVGVIASGEKLIVSDESKEFNKIKASFNDSQAVEMEGFGYSMAAFNNEHPCQIGVIRGISDQIINKEESDKKGYQEIASQNAVSFGINLARKLQGQIKTIQSNNIKIKLILQADFDKVHEPEVKRLVAELQCICNNMDMGYDGSSKGSIVIDIDSTEEGAEILIGLLNSKKLTHLGKYPIKEVEIRQHGFHFKADLPKVNKKLSIENKGSTIYMNEESLAKVTRTIYKNYKYLITNYLQLTSTGKKHFENRTFKEMFSNAQDRYNLYGTVVQHTLRSLEELLPKQQNDVALWRRFKSHFSQLIAHRQDIYFAETFFNSITRKVFNTVGFNPEIEYVDFSDYGDLEHKDPKVYEELKINKFSLDAVKTILNYFDWQVPYQDIERDADRVYDTIVKQLIFQRGGLNIDSIEFLKMAFYRNRGAFIIARIRHKKWEMPFVIPVLNKKETGLLVDTVIYTPNEVSILFSFTRASFFAHTTKPVELIDFLYDLMPHKSLGELYDSIGYYRHGKTILYRDLYRYLNNHDDEFIIAPGIKGMVMAVFTMKNYNFVFKVIKDKFDNPKTITRDQVIQKYRDVELNDRVGRLIYAHKFEHLEFDKADFSKEVLDELSAVAKDTVIIIEDKVHIKHLYLERRLDPLNVYLEHATIVESCAALIDYGHAIKDMAKANIFPGDLLLKNFGVTRHGRVIFYDYDEIQAITDIRFRKIPPPRNDYDELSAEPHFSVGVNDVFPEEFKTFMIPRGSISEVFMEVHGDLFDAKYWRNLQKDIENGEMLEFFAYDEKKRFHD